MYVDSMWCEHFLISIVQKINLESICCSSYAMHEYRVKKLIIINEKHLLTSWGKKKEKTSWREKRKEKKIVPFMLSQLSNAVYQRIELT